MAHWVPAAGENYCKLRGNIPKPYKTPHLFCLYNRLLRCENNLSKSLAVIKQDQT